MLKAGAAEQAGAAERALGKAAARTYDDIVGIRKRHLSLHISGASHQGTHLGSEDGRHCLPRLALVEASCTVTSNSPSPSTS